MLYVGSWYFLVMKEFLNKLIVGYEKLYNKSNSRDICVNVHAY